MQGSARVRSYNLSSLLAFNDIDKNVQVHLKNVYSTLSIGLILSCVAAYAFQLSSYLQSMVTSLMIISFVASLGSSLYIYFTQHTRDTINARLAAFFIFAFSTGLGMAPLLHVISVINPDTIPTAFLGAAMIFVSFSLAALFTRKRYYLFLGAALMSAISMLTTFSFMNLFIRSPAIYQAELYIGFAIFCGFVIFDTQLIVEKRKSGDTDFIWHTLDLFIDFVELFRHLLIILNSKRNRRDDDE
ncbi:BAX inhibitor 1 protein [Fasciolopsis buskii]|uniref:BAX inhibitor 1 protein n=1 Tax=Fasciolopsis buskii TaxID=27845 RepID=A0A8E0VE54_9TREM|nr:BAX inhibitor 1 protein [Fasciolopsis buski]